MMMCYLLSEASCKGMLSFLLVRRSFSEVGENLENGFPQRKSLILTFSMVDTQGKNEL
jgi:hypothetical protein